MKTRQTANMVIPLIFLAASHLMATNLTITPSRNQMILSWPLAGTNDFYLQSVTNLSAQTVWENAPDPATNGNYLVVTNQAEISGGFYRLQAWEYLFDGTNTSRLRSPSSSLFPSNSWVVTNGTLASKVVANATNLMSIGSYTNFELRFNWKCDTNGNGGVFYRFASPNYSGIPEYQLFDDANVATTHYANGQYTHQSNLLAAVYGIIAPTNKTLVPTGQWNDCRIIVQGEHVTHWLNGKVVVDYQLNNPAYTKLIPQGVTNSYIGFQNKGTSDDGIVPGRVYFGYIKIRRLP